MREPNTFRFRQERPGRSAARPRTPRPRPRARFLEGRARTLSVLEVDFPMAWHAPERLRRALFALRIQVIAEIRQQIGGRIVHWLRVVEFDGAPINDTRRIELQNGLLGLLEDAAPVSGTRGLSYSASTG